MGAQQEVSAASPKRVWVVAGASRGIGEQYVVQARPATMGFSESCPAPMGFLGRCVPSDLELATITHCQNPAIIPCVCAAAPRGNVQVPKSSWVDSLASSAIIMVLFHLNSAVRVHVRLGACTAS